MRKGGLPPQNLPSSHRSTAAIHPENLSSGIVSGLLAITGPPVIILEAAANGNFTDAQTIFWMFSVYFFGGLFSVILPLYYRIPIVGAHSITGVAFLATITSQVPYNQLIGGYIISSLLIFLVGIFGLFSKFMKYVPKEIIAAMMAGIITSYVVRLIVSIQHLPLIGGTALLTYFLFSKWKLRVPPVIAAVFSGFIVLLLTYNFDSAAESTIGFVIPQLQLPEFNLLTALTVSVPLTLLILSNDAAPGIGALEQNNYKPPINRIVTLSGIFSFFASLFGGQSANVAGMMTAICSGEETGMREKRYIAAAVSGVLILLFGIFAWWTVPFIKSLPGDFVSMLAGFALFGVLGSSLKQSFSKSTMMMSVTFTFVIAMSNISVFFISAPVWALAGGAFIANFIEKNKKEKQLKKG
ncbi:benzoate/H(+) symporter BenE family transporter [Neobacillus niacini]|uniref:benzoate/H(+) symporter BenE family transporter n=1 Tax=Neobacillus niacini TaxID=86668 RepID=UPI0009EDE608|nr:benzoate/H(+) symporter BenE family transporter [Neobacillus niacini]MEC1521257.1 benzoate/H(+) symporter BenE family transporter [Neobacillus niacini]